MNYDDYLKNLFLMKVYICKWFYIIIFLYEKRDENVIRKLFCKSNSQ